MHPYILYIRLIVVPMNAILGIIFIFNDKIKTGIIALLLAISLLLISIYFPNIMTFPFN